MQRKISWLLLAISIAGPAIWAWWAMMQFDTRYPDMRCGMPIIGIWFLAIGVSALLSLAACGVGCRAFIGLARPRPLHRKFELALLAGPAAATGAAIVASLFN